MLLDAAAQQQMRRCLIAPRMAKKTTATGTPGGRPTKRIALGVIRGWPELLRLG